MNPSAEKHVQLCRCSWSFSGKEDVKDLVIASASADDLICTKTLADEIMTFAELIIISLFWCDACAMLTFT